MSYYRYEVLEVTAKDRAISFFRKNAPRKPLGGTDWRIRTIFRDKENGEVTFKDETPSGYSV